MTCYYRYVSRAEYHLNTYPTFCYGPIYIMSTQTAKLLFEMFKQDLKEHYLWIEDVYITGTQILIINSFPEPHCKCNNNS